MKTAKILEVLSPWALIGPDEPESARSDADAEAFEALVLAEVEAARAEHGPYDNEFEALGVILEELDEFKEWVWKRRKDRDPVKMLGELVQVAATCRMASAECGYAGHEEFASEVAGWGHGTPVHSSHDGYARILCEIDRYKSCLDSAGPRKHRGAALLGAGRWAARTAADVGIVRQARAVAAGLAAGKKVR